MPKRLEAEVSELTADDCWNILDRTELGRLAVTTTTGVDIFPVNYLVHDRAIYFSSSPGSKLVDITAHHDVAFEVDGHDGRMLWSVVVHGQAHRLGFDAEIDAAGVLELQSWNPTDKWNYVRIVPETLSGRRFKRAHPRSSRK